MAMLVSTLAYSPAARDAATCASSNVGPFGGFNQDAFCPDDQTAVGGGYTLTDTNGNLLVAIVSETTIFGDPTIPPAGRQPVRTPHIYQEGLRCA